MSSPRSGEYPERRAHRRLPLKVKLLMEFAEERCFLGELTTYLSPGGMFVESESPMPKGTRFSFECSLTPDGPRLTGVGEVRWRRGEGESGQPPGMGVRFVDLDPEMEKLIGRAIAVYESEGLDAAVELLAASVDGAEKAPWDDTDPELQAPSPRLEDTEVLDPQVLIARHLGGAEEEAHGTSDWGTGTGSAGPPGAAPSPPPRPVEGSSSADRPAPGQASPQAPSIGLRGAVDEPEPPPGPVQLRSRVVAGALLGGAALAITLLLLWPDSGPDTEELLMAELASSRSRSERSRQTVIPPTEAAVVADSSSSPALSDAASPPGPAPATAEVAIFGRIEAIDWRELGRTVVVDVRSDGFIPLDGFDHQQLPDPPRAVIDLRGAAGPYPEEEMTVDSELVTGIRTTFRRRGHRLRLVVDLVDDSVVLGTVENVGTTLRLVFERSRPPAGGTAAGAPPPP